MSEAEFATTDTIGPDDLRIPAEPGRLRQAAQALQESADQLESVHERLAGDDDPAEVRGATAAALAKVARWNGRNARRIGGSFRELAEAAAHEADLVEQVRGQVEQLRSQWRNARQELFDQIGHPGSHGGKGDHVAAAAVRHPLRLARRVDSELTVEHDQLFYRLTGVRRAHVPSGGALLLDQDAEHAVQRYRTAVRGVLEEFREQVQRIRRVERDLEDLMERQPLVRSGGPAQVGFAPDDRGVSGPRKLRELRSRLEDGALGMRRVAEGLRSIGNALDDGRLEDHGGGRRRNVFEGSWEPHFERRVARLSSVAEMATEAIRDISRVDEDSATSIRQRDGDDD